MIKNLIYTALILVLSSLIYKTHVEAVTFHAILVGDTRDESLRSVIKKDLKRMEKHVDEIFESLDVDELEQITYTGSDTNATLLQDLEKLNIQHEDIVFFYFSGHGFYVTHAHHCWPFLYLSRDDAGINECYIMDILAKYNPRLLICLADCCNNILEEDEIPQVLIKQKSSKKEKKFASCVINKLFLENRGVILISSAAPGYYAEGTDEGGSDFTAAYIKMMKKVAHHPENASWDFICSGLQIKLGKQQNPQFQLDLH
jgi:hypothetical protein